MVVFETQPQQKINENVPRATLSRYVYYYQKLLLTKNILKMGLILCNLNYDY